LKNIHEKYPFEIESRQHIPLTTPEHYFFETETETSNTDMG